MKATLLNKSIKILLLVLLSFTLLYYGKPFLVPFLIASLLAMLILPLSMKLEKKMSKVLAILLSILLLLVVLCTIIGIFAWQISDISDRAPEIQQNISQKLTQLKEFVTNTLGIPEQQQQRILRQQQQSSSGQLSSMLTGLFTSLGGFLTDFIIVMVYIFLFLLFRTHFEKFVMKLVPEQNKTTARETMHDVRMVAQKYLSGMAIMIACLWVMYSIGFSLVGVDNAIFFAVLCGLLEIVPFVGNLVGVSITMLMSLAQGGNPGMLIGILATYAVVQFIQTYLLETLVVGRVISINPVFTILGLVGGELLWGIGGMILALPVLGIIKIICDHVEPLKPYGFLIGGDKEESPEWLKKIKEKIKEKFKG
jgi:predicted PurR-regulated permease PerM